MCRSPGCFGLSRGRLPAAHRARQFASSVANALPSPRIPVCLNRVRQATRLVLKVHAVSAAKMPIAEMPKRLKASRLGAICLRRSFGCSRLTRRSWLSIPYELCNSPREANCQSSGEKGLRLCLPGESLNLPLPCPWTFFPKEPR